MTPKSSPASPAPEKLSIILSKGSLDMVYPAFILANTAAALGREVHLFFTFWGMEVVHKSRLPRIKASPIGNPATHMPSLVGVLPGMSAIMTWMMKRKIRRMKIPTLSEMVRQAKETGVRLHACSTTMNLMKVRQEDLIAEVDDVVGAATFLNMSEGGQTLFV